MSNYEGFVEEIEEYVKRADTFIIPKEGKALNAFQHDCCEAFFGDIHVDNGKHLSSKESWECRICVLKECTKSAYKCNPKKKGVENLFKHLSGAHEDIYIAMYLQYKATKAVSSFFASAIIDADAKNIYGHIDDIIANNKTFSSVEKHKDRLYSNLKSISRNTLMKYVDIFNNIVVDKDVTIAE